MKDGDGRWSLAAESNPQSFLVGHTGPMPKFVLKDTDQPDVPASWDVVDAVGSTTVYCQTIKGLRVFTTETTSGWSWDMLGLKFIDIEGNHVPYTKISSSGHYPSLGPDTVFSTESAEGFWGGR